MPIPTSSSSPDPNAKFDYEFEKHLKALGFKFVEEYQEWCARNGFSTRINKHWHERGKERYYFKQAAVQARLAQKKHEKRKPATVLRAIFDGQLQESDLNHSHLAFIGALVAPLTEEPIRTAFLQLLLSAEGLTRLHSTQPVIPEFGAQNGNTFIEGLLALARNCRHWRRPLAAWKQRSHSARRQFSSLARHLLAKYPVPHFMDSAWFKGESPAAAKQQEWFRAIAHGKSIRELDFPVPFTKRMAQCFLTAPQDYSIEAALRWGQIIGLGGNARLVRSILGSRIGGSFECNDFWLTVICWLNQNPMFDPAQIAPLIDYIYRKKFEPREMVIAPDKTEFRPSDPDFSIKGRTATSLLRQMQEWHGDLRKQSARPQLEWSASGIGAFEWTEAVVGSNDCQRWTIIELLSRADLFGEGQTMRHCVASYDRSCALGETSIWSLGVERNSERRRRVLTIEVANSTTICQIRGRANRLPNESELVLVRRWAMQERLVLACHI